MAEVDIRDLNLSTLNGISECIKNTDRAYMASIERMASALVEKNARIVLLAGPSSSGKTTTANILKDYLSKNGHKTVVISMDNFYRDKDDPIYPREEDGDLDFESVHALHTDKINDCLAHLIKGEDVKIPRYIFSEGTYEENAIHLSVPKDGFVIMEGIHALNPLIIDGLERDKIVKLFISVSTNVNENGKRILSGRKIRFIRRMTRDSLYRGTSAAETLRRWESVLAGEDNYLYPFKNTADLSINTFHRYELGALKPFAEKAIAASGKELKGDYIETIISALSKALPIDAELVPETSLIREFIPGGIYEELY